MEGLMRIILSGQRRPRGKNYTKNLIIAKLAVEVPSATTETPPKCSVTLAFLSGSPASALNTLVPHMSTAHAWVRTET